MKAKDIFKKYYINIILAITGAIAGFLYWKFVGCNSGTCPIKSVWYWSTLWGAAIGYLAGDLIHDLILKRRKKNSEGDE